jgi:hypothetical protein
MTIYDTVESPGKAWVHVSRLPPPSYGEARPSNPFFFFFLLRKLLTHIEFPDGKTFDIECIYLFTLVEHSTSSHKIKAISDFVDSAGFARMAGGGAVSEL